MPDTPPGALADGHPVAAGDTNILPYERRRASPLFWLFRFRAPSASRRAYPAAYLFATTQMLRYCTLLPCPWRWRGRGPGPSACRPGLPRGSSTS